MYNPFTPALREKAQVREVVSFIRLVFAMPLTSEEQFRARAHRALAADKPFLARGSVNKAILEEIRAEIASGKKTLQASAANGVRRIKSNVDRGVQQIADAKEAALREMRAERESGAHSAGSTTGPSAPLALSDAEAESDGEESADSLDVPPSDPEELEEWKKEKEQERAWEAERPAREAANQARCVEEQAQRAATKLAVMKALPAPAEQMPEWFQSNVQRYYGQTRFLDHVRKRQRPLHEAAEELMMQTRKKCRQCREEGHKSRGNHRGFSCNEHRLPDDPPSSELAEIEEHLRDAFAGEAAQAALDMKREEDERQVRERAAEEAARTREAALEATCKDACMSLAPKCLECSDCLELGFGDWSKMLHTLEAHFCLSIMCDPHAKECERLAQQQPKSRRILSLQ